MAGYSGTPLPQKLGIKPAHGVAFIAAPEDFAETIGELSSAVVVRHDLRGSASFDVIVYFVDRSRELMRRFAPLSRPMSATPAFARPDSTTGSSTTRSARSTTLGRGCDSSFG